MQSLIAMFLAQFDVFEVTARVALEKAPFLKKKLIHSAFKSKQSRIGQIKGSKEIWERTKARLQRLPIHKGDILIVPSSMDGLKPADISPTDIIDFLLSLVGEEGTLVFPAYPQKDKMKKQGDALIYDVEESLAWTGLLPNIFFKYYPDVIRSPFPHNTLAAKGKHAQEMMKDNLDAVTAQGHHSSWEYCISHGAKILCLGIPSHLSNSIMHYPEDIMGDDWPIANWYEPVKYIVKSKNFCVEKTIWERQLRWMQYYRMFYTNRWFLSEGHVNETSEDEITIAFVNDSQKLADSLVSKAYNKNLIYKIPRRYYKKV